MFFVVYLFPFLITIYQTEINLSIALFYVHVIGSEYFTNLKVLQDSFNSFLISWYLTPIFILQADICWDFSTQFLV